MLIMQYGVILYKLILIILLISNISFADKTTIKQCFEKLSHKHCKPNKDKPYCDLGIFAICKDVGGNIEKATDRINHFPK